MSYRRYIVVSLLLLTVILGAVFAISYTVDPFGINRVVEKEGWNKQKPEFYLNTRKWKLFGCDNASPKIVFLGSSRVEYLAPEEQFDNPSGVYNLGLSGGTTAEMYDLARFAVEQHGVKDLYYGIDFYAATNLNPRYRTGFESKLMHDPKGLALEKWKCYLSWYSLESAKACIQANEEDPRGNNVRYQYNRYGSRTNDWRELQYAQKGERWLEEEFSGQLDKYREIYGNDTIRLDYKALAQLVLLKEYCDSVGVTLRFFVPPILADQLTLLYKTGRGRDYERFLRFLAKLSDYRYFGGCEGYTADRNMYWDSQHARKAMFEPMYQRMMQQEKFHDLFGVVVTEQNVEEVIHRIRKSCQH